MDLSPALDIAIIKLRPLREREVSKREYDRILASIKAIGLIEPLVVFPEGDGYVILDGVQRYRALLELGVEVVPCVLGPQREAFNNTRVREYLDQHHVTIVSRFEAVIADARG